MQQKLRLPWVRPPEPACGASDSAALRPRLLTAFRARAGCVGLALIAPTFAPGALAAISAPAIHATSTLERRALGAAVCRRAPASFDPGRIALEPTRSGIGFAGSVELRFAPSPFGVAVSPDGHHRYDLRIRVETQRRTDDLPVLVAWVVTPDLQERRKLGVIGDDLQISGRVDWNKFLIVVSAEASADADTWQGPLLLTGRSPSGWMHTMAGHGIFEAGYGFC